MLCCIIFSYINCWFFAVMFCCLLLSTALRYIMDCSTPLWTDLGHFTLDGMLRILPMESRVLHMPALHSKRSFILDGMLCLTGAILNTQLDSSASLDLCMCSGGQFRLRGLTCHTTSLRLVCLNVWEVSLGGGSGQICDVYFSTSY